MANTYYWSTSWVSTEGGDMAPGDEHYWWANPFDYGDAISVTAYPVTGNPEDLHRQLEVKDVRIDRVPDGGTTLLWTVKNVGTTYIPGYAVGSSVTNQ
ncbi:MAG TPA: hypothetical protein VKE40_24430 [Gemmataceae bacterium]|nr:hypothetical protein [Gemmataceae bacterium]